MKTPAHLSKDAKVVWERLSTDPAYASLFGPTDLLAMEVVCENYVQWTKAKQDLRTFQEQMIAEGKVTAAEYSKGDNRKLFGLNMTLKHAEATLRNWLIACGMTPPTRSKTEPPSEDSITEEPIAVEELDDTEIAALRKVVKRKRKAA